MRLEHFDVVHVGLPILDVPRMVPGHHPAVVVTPHHCTDRTVVCLEQTSPLDTKQQIIHAGLTHLQNGFKIER